MYIIPHSFIQRWERGCENREAKNCAVRPGAVHFYGWRRLGLPEMRQCLQSTHFRMLQMQSSGAGYYPMTEWPKTFAWTPGKPAYEFYPQYANVKLWEDGRCVITVRAPEIRTVGQEYYQMGETVCIQLPPDAANELRAFFGSTPSPTGEL